MKEFLGTIWPIVPSAIIGLAIPLSVAFIAQRESVRTAAILLGALALVGSTAGVAGGMSRAPAVASIIPAFLGMLGGLSIYLFGVEQKKGLVASLGAAALSLSLFMGFATGSLNRHDDHREIRAICAKAYTDANLLKETVAFERFTNQLGNLCRKSMWWRLAD